MNEDYSLGENLRFQLCTKLGLTPIAPDHLVFRKVCAIVEQNDKMNATLFKLLNTLNDAGYIDP